MVLIFEFIILICVFLLLHTYLIYPFHLFLLYSFRKPNTAHYFIEEESFPQVSCIISVYNEASIIEQKMRSLLESDYPANKIRFYFGSDSSTDNSDRIIQHLSLNDERISYYRYDNRRGKALVINDLIDESYKNNPRSEHHILLFTDANVILSKNVLKNLCKHFQDSKIALVDSKIIPSNLNQEGISFSENQYMSMEIKIKHMEGELWGAMMGAFGGCFAIRSSFLEKVPSRFLVDDFFISMSALSKGGLCINDLNAICYEGMPDQITEEFRRKARISAGNFQNLAIFYKLLFKKPFSTAYAFFSHKVLRWIGPILIICICLSMGALAIINSKKYLGLFVLFISTLLLFPAIDYILGKLGIHIKVLRGIRYFILMNIALLLGFINYLKGIQKSSWEPPKRSTV